MGDGKRTYTRLFPVMCYGSSRCRRTQTFMTLSLAIMLTADLRVSEEPCQSIWLLDVLIDRVCTQSTCTGNSP